MPVIFTTRNVLLAFGLLAVVAGAFSAYDATRSRPTDGAVWVLGGSKIRVVGTVPGGAAERAGLQVGDIIEGIDQQPIRSPRHAAQLLQSKNVGDEVEYLVFDRLANTTDTTTIRLESTRIANLRTYLVYCGLALIYFAAGLYVFWNNSHTIPARLFFLLCTLFLIYFVSASERSVFYYWSDVLTRNFGTLASLMLPPLFLHFFLVFPQPRDWFRRHYRWAIPLLYTLPLLYYAQFTYNQFFGTTLAKVTVIQQMTLGFYFTAGLASLVTTYVTSPDPTLRQRVKILTIGTVLGTLPFLVFNIALGKLLGREEFALFGAIPMVLVPVSFGYSIARYRLMELEVIIRRSIVYGTLTGITVGTYLVIVVLVGNTVLRLSGQTSQLVAIIATLLIAAAFAPARERIQGFLERQFFREKHDLQQALADLAKAIPSTIEVQQLTDLIRERITSLLHPSEFAFVPVNDGILVIRNEETHTALPMITEMIKRRSAPLTTDYLASELARLARGSMGRAQLDRYPRLRREMRVLEHAGLEVLVPGFAGERLVAVLGLGPKRSEAAYEGDELELLQTVAGQMAVQIDNTRLYQDALDRRQLEEEMAMARGIQQRMLPSSVPVVLGFEIAALNLASSQVSGDYYDFVSLLDGNMGIVISDVSGKGMPASLLASNLQASIRALAASHSQPGTILTAVNTSLYESTDPERFATLFLASLNIERRYLLYSNAGHNPPLLRRADGTCEWLEVGATPLGAFPGMEYPESEIYMAPGEVLVLFTDGVTEAEDHAEEQFGECGLEEIVHRLAREPAGEIVSGIRDAVFSHAGSENTGDDITLIVIRALASELDLDDASIAETNETPGSYTA